MKVSIITIVYNNQATIRNTILSVLNQTYPNIEYVLIDGQSSDGTLEIIKEYQDKIDVFISEPDKGLYDALNKGISHATGNVIGLLHSDDVFFDENVITRVADSFRESDSDVIYGNGVYTSRHNLNQIRRVYKSSIFQEKQLLYGWVPLHTCIYAKKEVFEEFGLYNTDYSIASDYEITLRWFSNRKIKKQFLDSYLVKMRLGGKSTTPKLQYRKSKEDLKIIRMHGLGGVFTLGCKVSRKIPQYIKGLLNIF